MHRFLKRRLNDPRFGAAPIKTEAQAWYQVGPTPTTAPFTESTLVPQSASAKPAPPHPLQLVRANAAKCWEGYERVPGTKEYADGSCRKEGSGGSKKKKRKRKRKRDGKSSSSSSSSSSESDGEGGRRKKKKAKKSE